MKFSFQKRKYTQIYKQIHKQNFWLFSQATALLGHCLSRHSWCSCILGTFEAYSMLRNFSLIRYMEPCTLHETLLQIRILGSQLKWHFLREVSQFPNYPLQDSYLLLFYFLQDMGHKHIMYVELIKIISIYTYLMCL